MIPNTYGEFLKIQEFEDFNCVPEEILDGIQKTFSKDLKQKSPYKGLNIKGINKNSIKDLGEIVEQCFGNKRKEERDFFNYRNTYGICKIIIKYIPMNGRKKEYQKRLYNLYKLFNKKIGEPIEIDSNEDLYSDVNTGIIQYINEQIRNSSSVEKTKEFTDDIFNLINENSDLLDPSKYSIIPNQNGKLKKIDELYLDNGIYEELKNILSEYSYIRDELMDKRIKSFSPRRIMSNEDIKNKINNLIDNNDSYIIFLISNI